MQTNEEENGQQNEQTNEEKIVEKDQQILDNEPKTGVIDGKLFIGIILIILVVGIVNNKRKRR